MSSINPYSAQINARLAAIESRIQANDFEEARRLIAGAVCYTGPLDAASTETIYLPFPQQTELMDRIIALGENNLRTPPRTHLLTKQTRKLPGKLPKEIVSLIASYEDFTLKLDEPLHISLARVSALFRVFCQSFSPKDLTFALNTQIEDLCTFPDAQAMAFMNAGLQPVFSSTFIFDLADRMLNTIRENQKTLSASGRLLSFPSIDEVGSVLTTAISDSQFEINSHFYLNLMFRFPENMVSVLKLVAHYPNEPIKIVTDAKDKHISFRLAPVTESNLYKWELMTDENWSATHFFTKSSFRIFISTDENGLLILTKSLFSMLVSCKVRIPQIVLNSSLNKLFHEYPFDAEYASLLVAERAKLPTP